MRCLAALLLFCVSGLASAQDLTWRWADHEVVSLRIQTYMEFRPGELRVYAGKNLDARVESLALGIETDCRSTTVTRRSQELECRVRKAQMGIGAVPQDQHNAESIAREYAGLLSVSRVQLELTREGRIKTVDLEGIPKDTEREGARHEVLRMLMARAFGGLELELPKDGDNRGEPWTQGGLPLIMRLPVTSGTVGKAKVRHRLESHVDGVVTIQTSGEASAQSGAELEAARAGRGSARTVQTVWAGTSRFDEQRGVLLSNDYTLQGTLTASGNAGGSSFFMTQVGLVEWVEDWEAESAAREAKEAAARGACVEDADCADGEVCDLGTCLAVASPVPAEPAPQAPAGEPPSSEEESVEEQAPEP